MLNCTRFVAHPEPVLLVELPPVQHEQQLHDCHHPVHHCMQQLDLGPCGGKGLEQQHSDEDGVCQADQVNGPQQPAAPEHIVSTK